MLIFSKSPLAEIFENLPLSNSPMSLKFSRFFERGIIVLSISMISSLLIFAKGFFIPFVVKNFGKLVASNLAPDIEILSFKSIEKSLFSSPLF